MTSLFDDVTGFSGGGRLWPRSGGEMGRAAESVGPVFTRGQLLGGNGVADGASAVTDELTD